MIKTIRIIVLSLLCVCLIGFMIAFIKSGFNFKNMKAKLVFNESYEIKDIETISITAKSADINIYESDDEKLYVKFYSDKDSKIEVSQKEKEFIIDNNQKQSVCFGFCFSNRKIDVYVPKEYIGNFVIKTKSGDVTTSLTSYNDYKINVTSGDIKIDNAKSLVGSATSGDLEIEQLTSSIDFSTTSGDIDIDIMTINKDSSIKVTSGDVEINKLSNAYVDVSAKSGDIEIKNNDRHAEYELKIRTTSGDVEVN